MRLTLPLTPRLARLTRLTLPLIPRLARLTRLTLPLIPRLAQPTPLAPAACHIWSQVAQEIKEKDNVEEAIEWLKFHKEKVSDHSAIPSQSRDNHVAILSRSHRNPIAMPSQSAHPAAARPCPNQDWNEAVKKKEKIDAGEKVQVDKDVDTEDEAAQDDED